MVHTSFFFLATPVSLCSTHRFLSHNLCQLAFPLSDFPLPLCLLSLSLCFPRVANCTCDYLIAMAISQLPGLLKVQMANCRRKEVILGTKLPRGLGLSPRGAEGRQDCWRKQGLQCRPWEGPKAVDWGVGVGSGGGNHPSKQFT